MLHVSAILWVITQVHLSRLIKTYRQILSLLILEFDPLLLNLLPHDLKLLHLNDLFLLLFEFLQLFLEILDLSLPFLLLDNSRGSLYLLLLILWLCFLNISLEEGFRFCQMYR